MYLTFVDSSQKLMRQVVNKEQPTEREKTIDLVLQQNEMVQEILTRLFKHSDYHDTQPGASSSVEPTKQNEDNWNKLIIPTHQSVVKYHRCTR